ncbi:class II fructose-bisphosphate aldolase [Thermoanaerobacterium thermosaccharolyticum]|uniref:class II fructose-bisphosphate aldolase n=1 Tax=Thermoanaerobacterium thermosaccharolyticum TaxID=1517 RepID=UPI003DA94B66
MPLVDSKALLIHALKNKYAVGAFNANNMEVAQAIIEAAEIEKSPVIVQISQGAIKYAGIKCISSIVKTLAKESSVPVVCHLDHGVDYSVVVKALKAGFTSLMFDGSSLSFEENVKITKELARMAHAAGIPLEAEIGRVPDSEKGPLTLEEMKKYYTTPEEAKEFFEKTNVDSLAVSVGSAHRMKVQSAELDIDRIYEISSMVNAPLVLHGASGVKDEHVVRAIKAGITKVNFATELNKAFTNSLKEYFSQHPEIVDVRKYGESARKNVVNTVREKIQLLNSNNRADDVLKYISANKFFESDKNLNEIVE